MSRRITGDALEQLVRQHAALQRVAILVARQPPTAEVFAVVTREAGMLLGARMTALLRVESQQTAAIVAGWSHDDTPVPVGSRGVLDGRGLLGRILRTGQAVRLGDFARDARRAGDRDETCGSFAGRWADDYVRGRGDATLDRHRQSVKAFGEHDDYEVAPCAR